MTIRRKVCTYLAGYWERYIHFVRNLEYSSSLSNVTEIRIPNAFVFLQG